MIKIGLDLAVRTVGLAIKYPDGSIKYDSYKGKAKDYFELQTEMIDWVFDNIMDCFKEEHEVILEGIFTGVNPKAALNAAKVQGGVIDRYHRFTSQYPSIITAISARKKMGIAVQIHKAEIQLEVIKRYQLGTVTTDISGQVIRERNKYERIKERTKARRKSASTKLKAKINKAQKEAKKEMDKTLSKMSTQIKKQTGLDEHMADALVLVTSI